MKIIIDVKTREGEKLTKKERVKAVDVLSKINLVIHNKIKGLTEGEGSLYRNGVRWVWKDK